MALQWLLNMLIAIVWMFLANTFSPQTFIVGYLLGLFMIWMMRSMFKQRFYMYTVWAILKLIGLFCVELWKANIDVVGHALRPKITMEPAFFAYPTKLQSDWEITLLSCLITLTPGTIVVSVSEDQQTLYIHAIDLEDVDEVIESIQQSFEKAIMEVTRT